MSKQSAAPDHQSLIVESLIAALGDPNAQVRRNAASALGKYRDPRSFESLVARLQDPDAEVRGLAAASLGSIGDPRAIEPLVQNLSRTLFQDGGPQALQAFGQAVVEPLFLQLKTSDTSLRPVISRVLGEIGDPRAADPLLESLPGLDWRSQNQIAEDLGKLGKPAVPVLISALGHPNRATRRIAARALAQIKDPRAVKPLAALLSDHPDIRNEVIAALKVIGDRRAIRPLAAQIGEKRFSEYYLADALQSLGWQPKNAYQRAWLFLSTDQWGEIDRMGKRAVPALLDALKDRHDDYNVPQTHVNAIDALVKTRDPRAVPPLIARLKNRNLSLAKECAEALGFFKDQRALKPLLAALNWEERWDEDSREWQPHLFDSLAYSATIGLARQGDLQAVEPLIAHLEDQDYEMRIVSAEALGVLKDPRAVEPLIRLLTDELDQVKGAAAWALGQLGDTRALSHLRALPKMPLRSQPYPSSPHWVDYDPYDPDKTVRHSITRLQRFQRKPAPAKTDR